MKNEIKAALDEAVLPLKQEIETLKAQLAALAPLAKAMEPPAPVKEAQAIFSAIPEATVKALKVLQVEFDPKSVWFKMRRTDGTTVSVKKADTTFRVRSRDQAGRLLKELNPPFNGLNAALKALA
jgi:hypothetical protein